MIISGVADVAGTIICSISGSLNLCLGLWVLSMPRTDYFVGKRQMTNTINKIPNAKCLSKQYTEVDP
jgi:hypothetical protein